jgi:hypothetical protein
MVAVVAGTALGLLNIVPENRAKSDSSHVFGTTLNKFRIGQQTSVRTHLWDNATRLR